jgi:NADH:ubiquinone oxidoreductase subunit 5 (subunit L)/multisubunit Na+/H+ antiporter MnhA subunit
MVFANTLALVLFVPLIATPFAYYLGKSMGKKTGWIAAAPLVVTLLLLLSVTAETKGGGSYVEHYEWIPTSNINFDLQHLGLTNY